MRTVLLILILAISHNSFAQLSVGFNPDEAKSLIAICNSYTFLKLYGSDTEILPQNYRKVYTSEVIGLDNVFQVYESNTTGVINFRGSTEKFSSKLTNIYSAMIKAQGIIKIDSVSCPYKFAVDTAAAVHSGYALALVLISPALVEQINILNTKGIYHILITGHSQGGALAHLCRAWLENMPPGIISSNNVFKTYAFANPMCGNQQFAREYNNKYSNSNTSYSLINTADAVPKMPLHLPKKKYGSAFLLFKSWVNDIKQGEMPKVNELVLQVIEPALSHQVSTSNHLIEKLVASAYVSVDMPDYVRDVDYFQTGVIRELEPFPTPKIPLDTLKMSKKEKGLLAQDEQGVFYNPNVSFSQHDPYLYFVGFLKQYFPNEYQQLDRLYLPEEVE